MPYQSKYHANDLRQHVTILPINTSTLDELGQPIETATVGDTVPCSYRSLSMKEKLFNGATVSDEIGMVVIRFYRGLNSLTHKLKFEGQTLDITGVVDEANRHRWMEVSVNVSRET